MAINRFTVLRWGAVLLPGALLYFFPVPGFDAGQRHLLAIFLATIVALVARPAPMGVSVLLALTLAAVTRAVPAARVLSGFANQTVWLIFAAFLFSRAILATGLGMRVAYLLIRRFGSSSLRLGYSAVASGALLAPFVPSDTARGGSVVYPVTRSLAQACGSEPGPTAQRIGSFLMLVGFHGNYIASAVFLTSMAANPLIADFAWKIGHVRITWLGWLAGSCVPAALSAALVPYLIYRWHPPEIRYTEAARALAVERLREMGPMSARERGLVAILAAVMAGWVTSPWHGVPNAFVALTGVSAQLIFGILTWEDLLGETRAWDALMWFAPLIMMADELNSSGVVKLVSQALFSHLAGWPWVAALAALALVYFYVHYLFASMTAQVTALYPAFFTAALAAGVPPMMAALPLAYLSSLNAGMTHYGTGSAPIFFGAGYVPPGAWWKIGFRISLVNAAIWLGVGPLWWKAIGLW
jgi:DASS family divalent anion:Na+ symporter